MIEGRRAPRGSPSALTIAGLDPSSGAGFTADLRAFSAAGAWGCAVAAVVTVQSTAGLVSAHPLPPELVLAQAREVLRHQRVRAIKTGALGSTENVDAVLRLCDEVPRMPLVVDPVMIATRAPGGARLLDARARDAMRRLSARASVVTPNVDEAEALLEARVRSVRDLAGAARALVDRGARAALVKGGHLRGEHAVDALAIGGRIVLLRARRVPGPDFHGGGCTLAALVAGRLAVAGDARDATIEAAVRWAKRRLGRAVARARRIGDGLLVLDP